LASRLVDLETLEGGPLVADVRAQPDRRLSVAMLLDLIRQLKPLDRQEAKESAPSNSKPND